MNGHNVHSVKSWVLYERLNQTKTNSTVGYSFKLYTDCNEIPNTIHEQRNMNTKPLP